MKKKKIDQEKGDVLGFFAILFPNCSSEFCFLI